jgi:hypothetical protein
MLGLFNSSGESLRRQVTQQTRVQLSKVTSALFSRFYSVSAKSVNSSTLWVRSNAFLIRRGNFRTISFAFFGFFGLCVA